MAIDDSSSSSFFAPWPDRLRHSAIILLAAGLALSVLVAFGELALARAAAVFICIAAAALVPWRLHDAVTSREDVAASIGRAAAVGARRGGGLPDRPLPSIPAARHHLNGGSPACAGAAQTAHPVRPFPRNHPPRAGDRDL
jgi:two-component system phosphate regulon sensor histidine kinase PhoR